jgi:dTDP-4-dehydrorhamnose 3,5-epimerase
MLFKEMELGGVFEITPERHEDNRGFFMRTYDDNVFAEHGLHCEWVQENHSFSRKKGTVRGLHFQFPPHSETKLVRGVSGEIFMAFVDLRKGSATFGKWSSLVLSEANKKMLYVPKGFALGMCAVTDNCTLLYKMDNYYFPESEDAIRWDDPDIGIEWPVKEPVLSEKDARAGSFADFEQTYGGLTV